MLRQFRRSIVILFNELAVGLGRLPVLFGTGVEVGGVSESVDKLDSDAYELSQGTGSSSKKDSEKLGSSHVRQYHATPAPTCCSLRYSFLFTLQQVVWYHFSHCSH